MQNDTNTAKCAVCGEGHVHDLAITQDRQVRHDGKQHTVHVEGLIVGKCDHCGELYFDNRADDQIQAALRTLLGVLTPEQVSTLRARRQLSQREVSRDTGIAAETVSRWESGHVIQSRSHDTLLRVYFTDPAEFRERSRRVAEATACPPPPRAPKFYNIIHTTLEVPAATNGEYSLAA